MNFTFEINEMELFSYQYHKNFEVLLADIKSYISKCRYAAFGPLLITSFQKKTSFYALWIFWSNYFCLVSKLFCRTTLLSKFHLENASPGFLKNHLTKLTLATLWRTKIKNKYFLESHKIFCWIPVLHNSF